MDLLCEAKLVGCSGWHFGRMSTDDAASSHGLPVLVLDEDGEPVGAGEGIMGVRLHDAGEDDAAIVRRAGYRVLGGAGKPGGG